MSYDFYNRLRSSLKNNRRYFYYETNVGAGLPIIDTLKHLHQSSDQITKIEGVFSGSLSYVFNTFSTTNRSFTDILSEAKEKGLTEPDPRDDLSGMDVARKLLILAREIGIHAEYHEIEVENLIPKSLRALDDYKSFTAASTEINTHFKQIKDALSNQQALRYVGKLDTQKRKLQVALQIVDQSNPLIQVKNADAIFAIYTKGYGDQPIVVQGAGAGASVTARGVYSDVIRIGMQL